MPSYAYSCPICGAFDEAVRKIDERHRSPLCPGCYEPMKLRITPTMVSVFHPYKTVAWDKEEKRCMDIHSRADHESFLRRNGFEEVGNDKSMAPPSFDEWKESQDRQRETEKLAAEYELTDGDVNG